MKFSTKYNLLFFGLLFSIIIVGQEKIILNESLNGIVKVKDSRSP